jgi:general secretion pathway protein D
MNIESKDVTGANTLTPTFTERTITGTARVQNNRTMMLASVATEVQSNGRAGLPVLGGLPILGRFFTSPTKENRRVDIVISVTPRVLRAPAVTPRDEMMRPSGTLQAPTTGSLEAMLRETERDEQIAAARRLPKSPVIQLPDAPLTYEAAAKTETLAQNKLTESQIVPNTGAVNAPAQASAVSPAQTQFVSSNGSDSNRSAATLPTDAAMPQPKSTVANVNQNPPVLQTADVASALKNLVAPQTNVATTSLSAKQDATIAPMVDVAPKADASGMTVKPFEPSPSVMEVNLSPDTAELKVGDKQQLQVRVKSDAPLGTAIMMLRFDPKVLKINSISLGDLFANAKSVPSLTQSVDEHGMVLISLAPGAGSAIIADGALINIDVEALAAGDSSMAFDISNVHVVASDGRPLLLQINPTKLTVK